MCLPLMEGWPRDEREAEPVGEIYIVKILKGWFTLILEPGRARTHDGSMNWVAVAAANNKKI